MQIKFRGRIRADLVPRPGRLARSARALLVLGTTVGVGACKPAGSAPATITQAPEAKLTSEAESPAYTYRYPARPPVLNVDGLKAFTERFRHHVLILEFWASWSPRSREEITLLADMETRLHYKGLRVIACTLDSPDDWSGRTVPLLQAAGANFPCVVVSREARREIKDWLAPGWSYDLPARFLIDRDGRIISRTFSDTPLATVTSLVHQTLSDDDGHVAALTTLGDDGTALRAKLVNVGTGEWESLPAALSDAPDAERLAEEIAAYVAARLDRANNQRIAILPFPPSTNRRTASPFGTETARQIRGSLRRRGFFDLVGPVEAKRMISHAGISAMAIDYDPSLTRGRLGVDYLIIGWIKGDPHAGPPRSAVVDGALAETGQDGEGLSFRSRRRAVEP